MRGTIHLWIALTLYVFSATGALVTCPGSGTSFHPHPTICSKFIQCFNREVSVINCRHGFYFDPIRGHCFFANRVDCVSGAETTTAEGTTAEATTTEALDTTDSEGALVTCPDTGTSFHAHPTSCSKFVQCFNGEASVMDCIDGFYFDPTRGHCFFANQVDCVSGTIKTTPTEGTITDTTSTEGTLTEGSTIENTWTDGTAPESTWTEDTTIEYTWPEDTTTTWIDHTTDVSPWPERPTPGSPSLTVTPPELSTPEGATSGGTTFEGSIPDGTTPESTTPEVLVTCPDTGTSFHAHPTSCSKFVQCFNGEASVMDCIDGFYFDPTRGHCFFADQVDCVSGTIKTTPTEGTITDTTSTEGTLTEGSTIENTWTDGTAPESTWTEDTTIEYTWPEDTTPEGATSGGTTSEGTTPERTTPGGTAPDGTTPEGTVPELTTHEDITTDTIWTKGTTTEGATYVTTVETPTTEDTTTKTTTTDATEEELVTCPASGVSFQAHPYSCSKFVQCINGAALVIDCHEGFYFDPVRGHCYFADQVDCVLGTPESTTTTTEQSGDSSDEEDSDEGFESGDLVECPESGTHFLPHPRSCSKFVKCQNGKYRVLRCVQGLYFDPQFGWCDHPSKVVCGTIEPIECPESGRHFLPYPSSCSKFIKCDDGDYRVVDCVEGLHFNVDMGWCESPSEAGCTVEEENGEEEEDEEGDIESFQCTGLTQQFFPHPTNCKLFIECNFGTYRVLKCFNNLHWNTKSNHCDFPENANCQN